MKKIGFIILLFFATSAFGQQFLWTTAKKDDDTKYVPIEDVTDKVLEFYDHYEYYYDLSGYNKDGFFKTFESSQSHKDSNTFDEKMLKRKIYEIDTPTVFAFKGNLGKGSVILVMCVSKENVNLIVFSNNYDADVISTLSDREEFAKWFKTLLN